MRAVVFEALRPKLHPLRPWAMKTHLLLSLSLVSLLGKRNPKFIRERGHHVMGGTVLQLGRARFNSSYQDSSAKRRQLKLTLPVHFYLFRCFSGRTVRTLELVTRHWQKNPSSWRRCFESSAVTSPSQENVIRRDWCIEC